MESIHWAIGCLWNALTWSLFFRWFQSFDWEGLQKQSMTPPIVPKVIISNTILVIKSDPM